MTDDDRPECGTYAAVVAHRKAGEPLDDACLAAEAEYAREWRKTDGGKASVRKQTRRAKIRGRALSALARLHPDDYQTLLAAETARADQEDQHE